MRRSFPWILAAILAVALLVTSRERRRLERSLSLLQAQASRSTATLKQSQRRNSELTADLNKIRSSQTSATVGGAPGDKGTKDDGVIVIHMKDVMRDHPEYASLWQKDQRRNMLRQYGETIAAMHLPADQAEKLKDLLVEKQLEPSDARDAAIKAGISPDSPALGQAMAQAAEGVNQEITSLVGPDGNAKLKEAVGVNNYSYTIKNYSYDLADAGVPLSPDQSQTLAQLMYDAKNSNQNPGGHSVDANKPDPETGLTPNDEQFLSGAAAVVSPAQLEILKTDRIEDNRKQAVMRPYYGSHSNTITISD